MKVWHNDPDAYRNVKTPTLADWEWNGYLGSIRLIPNPL